MLTIAKLFGKSPFAPLQSHMKKVASCIDKLVAIFKQIQSKELSSLPKLIQELCDLEHEADLTKNDIRNHLPKSLFLPIDRSHFLEVLSIQDSIADKAEEVGLLLDLTPLVVDGLETEFEEYVRKTAQTFEEVRKIIAEIDELLESSFGGLEAEKVKAMVEQTAYREHETTRLKQILLKKSFAIGNTLSAPSFYLLVRVIEEIALIAELSEKLANRIRMVLEVK